MLHASANMANTVVCILRKYAAYGLRLHVFKLQRCDMRVGPVPSKVYRSVVLRQALYTLQLGALI